MDSCLDRSVDSPDDHVTMVVGAVRLAGGSFTVGFYGVRYFLPVLVGVRAEIILGNIIGWVEVVVVRWSIV